MEIVEKIKGWFKEEQKPIEAIVQEHAVEQGKGIEVIEVPRHWDAKIVCDKKKGKVYGWYEGEFKIGEKHFIKYGQVFEKYGGVTKAIKEACKKEGFEPKEIIYAHRIARKEFERQG